MKDSLMWIAIKAQIVISQDLSVGLVKGRSGTLSL